MKCGASVALAVALWVLLTGAHEPLSEEPLPHPARTPFEGASKDLNASCAGCHRDIAQEWDASMHKSAWKDPVFQKAYALEPVAFCRSCHAPQSDPEKEPSPSAQHDGVSCTTCHVDSGRVISARAADAPHALTVVSALATSKACASCHQFNFPKESRQLVPEPMQRTVDEHDSSSHANTPCQSCHMPTTLGSEGPHKSHAFAVLGNPDMLRRAVEVHAERDDVKVILTLASAAVGHAFPTGDMFRRLEVRAWAVGTEAPARPVILARTFADRPISEESFGTQRIQVADTRVPPPGRGERVVVLKMPEGAKAFPAHYQVVYQRMSSPMAQEFAVSQVMDEVVVAEGELPPSRRP